LGILGGTAMTVGLLALTALGASRRVIIGVSGLLLLGVLLLAVVPEEANILVHSSTGRARLTLNSLIVGPAGLLVVITVASAAIRLGTRRADRFLMLWLALEVVGYFALTPFAAARRVLGLVVVATLVAGRLAARSYRSEERRHLVLASVILSVL